MPSRTTYVKEKGCVKGISIELGAQTRVTVQRDSLLYHVAYWQRTYASRMNSQAKFFGMSVQKCVSPLC